MCRFPEVDLYRKNKLRSNKEILAECIYLNSKALRVFRYFLWSNRILTRHSWMHKAFRKNYSETENVLLFNELTLTIYTHILNSLQIELLDARSVPLFFEFAMCTIHFSKCFRNTVSIFLNKSILGSLPPSSANFTGLYRIEGTKEYLLSHTRILPAKHHHSIENKHSHPFSKKKSKVT